MRAERERRLALQHTLYASANPTRRYLHCSRRDWVMGQIEKLGPVALALEVGPGSGVYLPTLCGRADCVIAVDVEPVFLEALATPEVAAYGAAKLFRVQADVRASPLREQCVDLLLCSEVIEHVADSPLLLRALADTLAPGGFLLLTTPQPYSPVEVLGKVAFLPGIRQLVQLIYREPIEPTGHINLLGRHALEAQLAQAGFEVLERECLGLYLPVIAEFGGDAGRRLLQWLEGYLRATPLRCFLWTQCYLLRLRCG
ncbi:MAG: SAM-dependent methyltransferase [Halieaceae bacterium]|jgi:SAM-dependent methyltransferase